MSVQAAAGRQPAFRFGFYESMFGVVLALFAVVTLVRFTRGLGGGI